MKFFAYVFVLLVCTFVAAEEDSDFDEGSSNSSNSEERTLVGSGGTPVRNNRYGGHGRHRMNDDRSGESSSGSESDAEDSNSCE